MIQAMGPERCARCGRAVGDPAAFQFQTPGGLVRKCLGCALRHGPMLRRSGALAMIVGTVLVGINQGDILLAGHWPSALFWKLPLTYAVPFIVATLGALGTGRAPRRKPSR
jgi:hypothetical protein